MIALTNTVVDPLAMVIEFLNAFVADVAVTGIPGEDCFASWTQPLGITLVCQLAESQALGPFYDTWVSEGSPQEEDIAEGHVNVEEQIAVFLGPVGHDEKLQKRVAEGE